MQYDRHMLSPSDRIEHAIYSFIDQVDSHEGRSTSFGTLQSRVGEPDPTVLLRLVKDLHAKDRLELKKWLSLTDCCTYPDPHMTDAEFFFRGDFRLFLTANGRRRYEELAPTVKAQARIDKVLKLESDRFTDTIDQVQRKAEESNVKITEQYQGLFRKAKFLEARLNEIEDLIRERVKLRMQSIVQARELLSAEHVNEFRYQLMEMIDSRGRHLKSLMPRPGSDSVVSLTSRNNRDELQHLKELADRLVRRIELEQDVSQLLDRPLVFISCGQYTDQEKSLGIAIANTVKEMTGCEGYFAENQNSLQGLTQHIFVALSRAAGFIAVMHHRGHVETPAGKHVRGSVWVEQEIAIAAFLTQAQGRNLPVLVYIQRGIEREGVRQQLRLKPVEFETEEEVLEDLKGQIANRIFQPAGVAT
jgi:hypothetical protein